MKAYAIVGAIVAACTLLNWALSGWLAVTDLAMVYLLGVVVAAIYFPWNVSVAGAALSLLAFDFFFVPPVYTLRFGEGKHLITGLVLLIVGVVTSLLAARARSASEEELRNSLLASLSHDMRTPLAVIAGSASTLRENRSRLSVEEQDQLLDAIFETSQVISVEVSDILEMTRLRAGPVTLDRQWHPIEELVGAALERCKSKLNSHVVAVDVAADLPMLFVDGVLIEKLFVNLIENAACYTPDRTRIEILASKRGDRVEIAVRDNGPGLPSGAEGQLFKKFVRVQREGSIPGSGLGLSICRAIAELHGAQISAHNVLSGGAEFVVLFPHMTPPLNMEEA